MSGYFELSADEISPTAGIIRNVISALFIKFVLPAFRKIVHAVSGFYTSLLLCPGFYSVLDPYSTYFRIMCLID